MSDGPHLPESSPEGETPPAPLAVLPGTERSGRILVLFGLAGLALTQPTLDVFGGNPEFFVASNLEGLRVALLAMIVAIVPALGAWVVSALVTRINRTAGAVVFALTVFVFACVFAMGIVHAIGVERTRWFLLLAGVAGAAIAFALLRFEPIHTFFRYLAVANLAFLALFLFASRSSEVVWSADDGDIEPVSLAQSSTPVVWLVLDEFPLATMLRPDGTINEERFPELADLAQRSTWYRNAASPASLTTNAVPSLLTGNIPEKGQLPTFRDNPQNAFSLLGSELPIERYEIVTDLCPEQLCEAAEPGSLRTALVDFAVVLGHQKLPEALRARLPAIDDGWGGFVGGGAGTEAAALDAPRTDDESDGSPNGGAQETPEDPYEKWNSFGPEVRGPAGQMAALTELTAAIGSEPAFTFIHVALPHAVWLATPYGDDVMNSVLVRDRIKDPDNPRYEFSYRQMLQIHTLQASATDRKIGELVDRLEDVGIFDEAMLVISSDHGTSMLPPSFGRNVSPETADAVLRVPLFIKLPGQSGGEVDDRAVSTLDVLPSIADVLGADVDWDFDGHSLYDGSEPHTERRVDVVARETGGLERLYEVARRSESFFGDSSLDGLAMVGEHSALVGTRVDDHVVGASADLSWVLDQRPEVGALPNEDGNMPFVLTGVVDAEPSKDFLIAVNGKIAGVASGFVPHPGDRYRWGAYVLNAYRPGQNQVEAFTVDEGPDGEVVLHPISDMEP